MRPRLPCPSFERHYRLPRATRLFFRCFAASGALIVLASLLDNQGEVPASVIAGVCYTALALVVVWAERAFRRAGMYESAEGIRVVNMLRSVDLRWELIARFEHAEKWPRSRVLVGENGRVVPILGTAQGARIVWKGGETRDIVGVLNERLLARRSLQAGGERAAK
jgi:hypothetical protein